MLDQFWGVEHRMNFPMTKSYYEMITIQKQCRLKKLMIQIQISNVQKRITYKAITHIHDQ